MFPSSISRERWCAERSDGDQESGVILFEYLERRDVLFDIRVSPTGVKNIRVSRAE